MASSTPYPRPERLGSRRLYAVGSPSGARAPAPDPTEVTEITEITGTPVGAATTWPETAGAEVLARLAVHLTLAGLPLLAISAHVLELLPMHLAAALVVVPLTVAVVLLALFAPIAEERIVLRGALWGAFATLIYDVFRLDTVYLLGWWGDFIPAMGTWVLGLEPDALGAGAIAGYLWRYAGDGAGIGSVFFVLVAATGLRRIGRARLVGVAVAFAVFPVWAGLIATVGLAPNGQTMMFPLTPTTVILSLIGHLIFGLVLGLGCARSDNLERDWPWPPLPDLLGPARRPRDRGHAPVPRAIRPAPPAAPSAAPLPPPRTPPAPSPDPHDTVGGAAWTQELDKPATSTALVATDDPRATPQTGGGVRLPWRLAVAVGLVVLVPLAITALSGAESPGAGLSVQLGVLACALLVLVVLVASRLRCLYRAWGMELVMRSHRVLGVLVLVATGAHIVAAVAHHPRGVGLLNPLTASNAVRAGMAATLALIATAVVFARRARSRPRHATRRAVHLVLAGYTLLAVVAHVVDIGHLIESPAAWLWMAGLVVVVLLVLMRRWLWRPLRSLPYLVEDVRAETESSFTLTVVPAAGEADGMRFQAGQFVWMRLRQLPMLGEEHPFSISSSAEQPGRLEFTIETAGRFTEALRRLHPGRRLWLDGPHGTFTGAESSDGEGLVLIAGGSGLGPMLSILRTLADRGDRRGHTLLFSHPRGRRVYEWELARLHERLDLHVEWLQGRWIDPALLRRVLPPDREAQFDYYVCGPPQLVDGALAALTRLGVTVVHTERF